MSATERDDQDEGVSRHDIPLVGIDLSARPEPGVFATVALACCHVACVQPAEVRRTSSGIIGKTNVLLTLLGGDDGYRAPSFPF